LILDVANDPLQDLRGFDVGLVVLRPDVDPRPALPRIVYDLRSILRILVDRETGPGAVLWIVFPLATNISRPLIESRETKIVAHLRALTLFLINAFLQAVASVLQNLVVGLFFRGLCFFVVGHFFGSFSFSACNTRPSIREREAPRIRIRNFRA